ncbi:MAG: ThuA domain-containing protein [Phycisphaeraceae bacterium]
MAKQKKQALIVQGGWDGHTPKESAEVFAPELEREGFDVAMENTLEIYADEQRMRAMDLIVQVWTGGELTKEQWEGLSGAVYHGTGLAGFHGGLIDSFRANTGYQFMTGGQWVAHPGNCEPTYTVNIVDRDHEITAGLGEFTLPDTEQYYLHVDPGVHVLCTTTFTGEHGDPKTYPANTVMPYAWTRRYGDGRIFVAAWGHTYRDFDVPEAKEIVKRGMAWASR